MLILAVLSSIVAAVFFFLMFLKIWVSSVSLIIAFLALFAAAVLFVLHTSAQK